MHIHISTTDGVPIYLQIVNQLKYLVASGRLAEGEELPPIRVLAERIVVNPNTVARAYRELEVAGVVEKRRTAGTYVSGAGSGLARRERMRILAGRVDGLLAEARQMGVGLEDVLELVRQRDASMQVPTIPPPASAPSAPRAAPTVAPSARSSPAGGTGTTKPTGTTGTTTRKG